MADEAMTESLVTIKQEHLNLELEQQEQLGQETEDPNRLLEMEESQITESNGHVGENREQQQQSEPVPGTQDHQTTEHMTTKSFESKFPSLRLNLEVKNNALNSAWSQLTSILTEYKAELLLAENQPRKFDNVTNISDIDELRNQLIEKENDNIRLRQQCESFQTASEQAKMDLSIKDSLLQKYQDDLLQKETQLIHAQTKLCKLENKVKLLEAKDSSPHRRMMKTTMTPGRFPGRRMDLVGTKFGAQNVAAMRPFQKRTKPGPLSSRKPVVQQVQRQPLPQPHPVSLPQPVTSSAPSSATPTSSAAPIVCIEVDDDDVMDDVRQAAQSAASEQEGLYMEQESYSQQTYEAGNSYSEEQNQTFDASTLNESGEYSGLDTSSMEHLGQDSIQGALEQNWEQLQAAPPRQRASAAGTSNKGGRIECTFCPQLFSRQQSRKQHEEIVHHGLRKHLCQFCGKSFTRKNDVTKHLEKACKKRPMDPEQLEDRTSIVSVVGDGVITMNPSSDDARNSEEMVILKIGDYAFQCQHCAKVFSQPCHLQEHIEAKHLASCTMYKCAFCTKLKPSKRRRDVARHVRDCHAQLLQMS